VIGDSLSQYVLTLLARGHDLYGRDGEHVDAGTADAPEQLRQHAQRLAGSHAGSGMEAARLAGLRMAAGLRRTADADSALATALADARTEHAMGRRGTRRVLDDARGDSLPAADTPLGRQEALRRMAARLHQQRRHVHRSQRTSQLLAQRLRRSDYPRPHATSQGRASRSAALALGAVRYEKNFAPGHISQRIAAALDHMGITDPAARRNWIRGYETLIARESGGRPSAIAAQPATAVGAPQQDGHGLGFARGIAQTIPATFARYHQPGTSANIYDPVANICASMNYVIHRYGVSHNGENLAAVVQQADAHRPPKGY
jgi:SLT domain-containing protein